jgi:hypothetical protein
VWPPPHPSPPPPPPPEYGSPGVPPDRSWVWLVIGGVVVLALAVVVGATLLGGARTDDRSVSDVPPPTPTPAPSDVATSPVASNDGAPIRCWDGSGEEALDDCSLPDGAQGLAWVFPHLSEQRCGRPGRSGPGVVLRILCTTRFSDGSRILIGYYQWESVEAGSDFYGEQDLQSAAAGGFLSWTGQDGESLKSALLYADAPFSQTITLPEDVQATGADLAILQPRPPEQLRGEPVG